MKTLYTAHATTVAGRGGHTETDDKKIVMDLAPPGSSRAGTNPEQLFACGYSACFGGAVGAVAKKHDVSGEPTVKADVNLNQDDNGFFISAVLDVSIAGFDDQAKLEEIVKSAHEMCPYSKATRGNIEVKLKANGKDIA